MTMSSGFFDSVGHDRRYTARQWGQIMDYLIRDGVYYRYPETGVENDANGKPNKVLAPFEAWVCTSNDPYFNPDGPAIAIGPGRAWFDHTWTWVQSPEFVALPPNDNSENRVDLIVLTIDKSTPVRQNYFRVIQGDPNSTYAQNTGYSEWKAAGKLQGAYGHDDEVHDVPIIAVKRRTDEDLTPLNKNDLTSLIGWNECPYVTNIAADGDGSTGVLSTEALFSKWQDQWSDFINKAETEYDAFFDLFGDSENLWKQEWGSFLDGRAADFMRWLKMYDRAYHTWYQGAVNWTYEYIRNLQTEEQGFADQWATAIQKAQDLLDNGFTEYTQKIDEILDRFNDIDNLVDDKMAELKNEVDSAIAEAKQSIIDNTKTILSEVITEQMTTIVEQVVAEATPDIRSDLEAEVENMVKSELDTSFEDRLKSLEDRLDAYQQQALDTLNQQVDTLMTAYNNFQENIQYNINQAIEQYLSEYEDLQQALDDVARDALRTEVSEQLASVREPWMTDIKTELAEGIKQDIDRIFTERFETEKDELIQYVKDQQKPITDQAVTEKFNAEFEAKREELEQQVNDHVDQKSQENKEELSGALSIEVENKVGEAEQRIDKKIDDDNASMKAELSQQIVDNVSSELDTRMPEAKASVKSELKSELTTELTETLTQTVTDQVSDAKTELAKALTTEVTNKFNESFDSKYTELEQQLNDHIDTKSAEVKEQLHDSLSSELSDSLTQSLTKTVTDQVNAAEQRIDEKVEKDVQTTFDTQFAEKQQELEGQIQQQITDGVGSLDGHLDQAVDDKFAAVESDILAKADAAVEESAKTLNDKIDKTLASVYKPKGTGPFEHLPQLLDASMLGYVYNVKDDFTTDDRFVEGSGKAYPAGTNVVVVDAQQAEFDPGMPEGPEVFSTVATVSDQYKFDVLPGFIDLSLYATQEDLSTLQQTVEGIKTDISGNVEEQLKSVGERLDGLDTAVQAAQTTADGAQSAAEKAQATADTANTTAEAAKTSAATANTTANQAKTTADGAATTAGQAVETANGAKETAEAAQTSAGEAVETANGAKTTADAASKTASEAKTTAEGARTVANGANDAAQAATTTANAAKAVADAAVPKANLVPLLIEALADPPTLATLKTALQLDDYLEVG